MKITFRKSFFIGAILLVVFGTFAVGQTEIDEPRLLYSFGSETEESIAHRIDLLEQQVLKAVDKSKVLFLVTGPSSDRERFSFVAARIIQMRGYDAKKYLFESIEGNDEAYRVQVWHISQAGDVAALIRSVSEGRKSTFKCPSISITGPPAVIQPGATMGFWLAVHDTRPGKELAYNWTVNKGLIVEGQGTRQILVGGTKDLGGQTITAKVEVIGLSKECTSSFSGTGVVAQEIVCVMPLEEFGVLPSDDVRLRIDNLSIWLQSDPTAYGLIISYGRPDDVTKRHNLIRDHIEFRNFDASRFRIVYRGYEEEIRTRIWTIPEGVDESELN